MLALRRGVPAALVQLGRVPQFHQTDNSTSATHQVAAAEEALGHGIVSRVVPADELDATAIEMAEKIAAAPAVTVKLSRMVIGHLSHGTVRTSMDDELIYQTFLNRSDDFAEFRSARSEDRPANYTGS